MKDGVKPHSKLLQKAVTLFPNNSMECTINAEHIQCTFKCNAHSMEYTFNAMHIQWNTHSMQCTFNGIHIQCNAHSMQCTFNGIHIQCKMRRVSNKTQY